MPSKASKHTTRPAVTKRQQKLFGTRTMGPKVGPPALVQLPPERAKSTSRRESSPGSQPEDTTSLEYFAASFLASVEQGSLDNWMEYSGDSRVERIASAVRKLGVERIDTILGGGSFGVAALDYEDHVLKLTTDPTEVQAGAVLAGHDLPHVAWIAGAWYVKGVRARNWGVDQETEDPEDFPVGVLSMQKLEDWRTHATDAQGYLLSRAVNDVKREHKGYPGDLEAMRPVARRVHLKKVSAIMESTLREPKNPTHA